MNMTPTETALHIAGLLHESRSSRWTSDRALELSAAMRGQRPEVLAMALLDFSNGLLRAARGVVELQIGCQESQAARNAGELQ